MIEWAKEWLKENMRKSGGESGSGEEDPRTKSMGKSDRNMHGDYDDQRYTRLQDEVEWLKLELTKTKHEKEEIDNERRFSIEELDKTVRRLSEIEVKLSETEGELFGVR